MRKFSFKILAVSSVLALLISSPASVCAESDQPEASLCFDAPGYEQVMKTSNSYIKMSNDIPGHKGSALSITADYDGGLPSNSIIYLTSSDFGLKDFSGCRVSLYADLPETPDIAPYSVSICSSGSEYAEEIVKPATGWKQYEYDLGDTQNTLIGISVYFSEPYSGQICSIDDLTITGPGGEVLKAAGITDEAVKESSAPQVIAFVLLSIAALTGLFFVYPKAKAVVRKINQKIKRGSYS